MSTVRASRPRGDGTPGRLGPLLVCGAIAGPLFIAIFVVEGATRDGYNPVRHPVSSLALGPHGWVQTVNFLVVGLLYLAFALGLGRAPRAVAGTCAGSLLIGAMALGLLGSGIFVTDPVSGYPPGTPDLPDSYSLSGALHDLFALPTFFGLPAAAFVFARWFLRTGHRGWALYSAGSALSFLLAFVLTSAAFGQAPHLVEYGGFMQRVTIVIGLAWLTALALRTRRALLEWRVSSDGSPGVTQATTPSQ